MLVGVTRLAVMLAHYRRAFYQQRRIKLSQQILSEQHEKLKEIILKMASSLRKTNSLKSTVEMARIGLTVSASIFDQKPHLLNLINGTYNLEFGEFQPHSRSDMLTKCAGAAFDPTATCPLWLSFLNTTFLNNTALIRHIQKIIGYCLSADTSAQQFYLFLGGGENGKSVFTETYYFLLGDYATTLEASSLLAKNTDNIRNDIAKLVGVRFVYASEPPAGRKLDEGLVKLLTGGSTVTARFLHKEFFEFKPQFKLFLETNYLPRITGTDHGIWRRVIVIPFNAQLTPEQKDPKLLSKLTQPRELSGILNWAIEGHRMWQEEGMEPLPQAIAEAVHIYRNDSDNILRWLSERCYIDVSAPEFIEPFNHLYSSYCTWCVDEGETTISTKAFSQRLATRGLRPVKQRGMRSFAGIRLRKISIW